MGSIFYWDEGYPLRVEGGETRSIVMARGPRAITVVTDYGAGGACTLTADLARLGLPAPVRPRDFETGEAVASPGPGQATITLARHDFKVIVFE